MRNFTWKEEKRFGRYPSERTAQIHRVSLLTLLKRVVENFTEEQKHSRCKLKIRIISGWDMMPVVFGLEIWLAEALKLLINKVSETIIQSENSDLTIEIGKIHRHNHPVIRFSGSCVSRESLSTIFRTENNGEYDLAYAKAVFELHNWTINDSTDQENGIIFAIHLPDRIDGRNSDFGSTVFSGAELALFTRC